MPWGLDVEGGLALAEPSDEALVPLPQPARAGEAGAWVAWTGALPFSLLPIEPFRVSLAVDVASPGLARDPLTGASLLVDVRVDGRSLDGAPRAVSFPSPAIGAGGDRHAIDERFNAGGLPVARNATVELRVASLAPAPTALVVDLAASSLHLESATATSIGELDLQTGGFPAFPLEGFALASTLRGASEPDDSRERKRIDWAPSQGAGYVATMTVGHDRVRFANGTFPVNATVYLVVRGEEPSRSAMEHHHFVRAEERNAAAHAFTIGDVDVRAYPGVAIVAPLRLTAPGEVAVRCVTRCPAGWTGAIAFAKEARPGLYFGESGFAIVEADGTVRDDYEGPLEEAAPVTHASPTTVTESRAPQREIPLVSTAISLVIATLACNKRVGRR